MTAGTSPESPPPHCAAGLCTSTGSVCDATHQLRPSLGLRSVQGRRRAAAALRPGRPRPRLSALQQCRHPHAASLTGRLHLRLQEHRQELVLRHHARCYNRRGASARPPSVLRLPQHACGDIVHASLCGHDQCATRSPGLRQNTLHACPSHQTPQHPQLPTHSRSSAADLNPAPSLRPDSGVTASAVAKMSARMQPARQEEASEMCLAVCGAHRSGPCTAQRSNAQEASWGLAGVWQPGGPQTLPNQE